MLGAIWAIWLHRNEVLIRGRSASTDCGPQGRGTNGILVSPRLIGRRRGETGLGQKIGIDSFQTGLNTALSGDQPFCTSKKEKKNFPFIYMF